MSRKNDRNIRLHNEKLRKAAAKAKKSDAGRKEKLAEIMRNYTASKTEE